MLTHATSMTRSRLTAKDTLFRRFAPFKRRLTEQKRWGETKALFIKRIVIIRLLVMDWINLVVYCKIID